MMRRANLSPSATIPAAIAVLRQAREFLSTLPRDAYTRPSDVMFGATVGQHTRHALDHFAAALDALENETVDYDHLPRPTDVDTSLDQALRTIDVLTSLLKAAPNNQADRLISIRVMISAQGDEAELTSSFARELAFATHHAIHHYAIIAAIATALGHDVPDAFGKTPATVNHEQAAAPSPDDRA